MCCRVGNVYSSYKSTDMGIPQGSIIAPLLFIIYLLNLPKVLAKLTHLALFADDIATWINTSLRKNTKSQLLITCKRFFDKKRIIY